MSCGSPGSSFWLFWNVYGNKNRLREISCGEVHSKSPGKKDGAEASDSTSANSQREPHRGGWVFNSASQQASVHRDDQAAEVG